MRDRTKSDPCVREIETRSPRPAPASHADRARRIITVEENEALRVAVDQSAKPENRETRRSSKQRRADRRWARFSTKPRQPSVKLRNVKVIGECIRGLGFTPRSSEPKSDVLLLD